MRDNEEYPTIDVEWITEDEDLNLLLRIACERINQLAEGSHEA